MPTLPRFVVVKSNNTNKYVCYVDEVNNNQVPAGYLMCCGEDAGSQHAKFEVEKAKSKGNERFVHIKSCYNNKYWRRAGTSYLIAATADKPEEDKSKNSCTLFEPVSFSGQLNEGAKGINSIALRFLHVQQQEYLNFVGSTNPDPKLSDVYFVIDWESLIMKLPKHVAFKGRNGNYLSTNLIDEHPHLLQFESTVIGDPTVVNEVFTNADRSIRIKSKCSGKFWRLTKDDWICADSDDSTNNDPHTMFWPFRLNDNVITLRNKFNNKICVRFTATDKITGGLSAYATTINEEAYMGVEEIPDPASLVIKLPKYVAFKDRNGNYLSVRLTDGPPHLLQFECTVIGDPIVVNEVFTNADGSLRIKSNSLGKFWRLTKDDWICANSDDYTSNDSHTLFWPIRLGANVIALRNKGNKKFCTRSTSEDKITSGLRANITTILEEAYMEVEEIPKQMSMVMKLPKHVAFKGRNGNYLRARLIEGHPYPLQLESTVIGDPTVMNEVFTNADGSLRIKYNSSEKYWRVTGDDWICADSDDSSNNDPHTMFWLVRLGENAIALRNKLNNKFCMRFTAKDKITDELSANVTTINEKARLEVVEIPYPDSLVIKLPKYVAFKDRNGNYLSTSFTDGQPHLLQFEPTVIGDPTVVNEVFTNTDRSLRIKSNSSRKFWRLAKDDWICADSDDSTNNYSHTLFWPVRLGDNVIALRNKLNDNFCLRYTTNDKIKSGLNANVTTINEETHLEVEEIPHPESLVIKLPKHVAFKDGNSNYLSTSLIDEQPHALQFECTVIGDPTVVNEVFTNADESLRIKSNFMGKFWRCSEDDWISADSDDSTSNDSYTMFWPVKLGDNVIALRNKGNNKFCTRSTAKDKITGSLSANGTTIVEEAYLKVEKIPEQMSMVMKLPKHVAFKDRKGNYLRARLIEGHPHSLQFESTVIGDPTVVNEVFTNADGSLRIKYNSSGKYWRVSKDDWICADSDDSTNNDPHTLFWPVRLGDNAIALRNKHNKKFCMRFTANDKITVTTINEEARLEVEEIPYPNSLIIKLPKYVAFKDRNGNYISTSFPDGQPHLLQFEPTVIGDPTVLNEVFINADRSLRIKSNSSRKFWMLVEDDWICADSDDSTGNYSHTLFWPVRLGDNVIALRNRLNDKFCSRFTANDKIKSGLKANVTTIDEETHLEVEEIPHPESLVMKLPKHVAFKDHNGNYLSTSLIDGHPHVLQFDCTVIGDPIVVNEVFTNADESLRIKSNFMGKFWKCSEDDWIYADSDDSTSNDSYTMFWPVKLGHNVIALRNKGNNKFCTRSTAKDKITGSLSANGTTIVEEAYLKVEKIPKHMSMVMKLPKHVAFKDINGNYLRARLIKGHPHLLQFESTVIGDPTVGNEVFANSDGSLRIKYNSSGKYWRVSEDDWICADSDDSTNNDPHTLFWPVRLGDNAIALRNKHNKKFCMRFTANDKITDGLRVNVTTINEETHLEVEEIPDPDSAVIKLPKYVAFKDCNGNYISTSFTDGQPHLLQFEPTVIGDPTVLNEVFINADRSLRIKSNSSRKFWMLAEDDWICTDSDDSTSNYSYTLFWPVRLGDNVIALRNKLNDKFCSRFTANDKIKSGLKANVTTIDEETHLEVEEIPHPESLVMKLPKHVAFKDHNGNYLSTSLIDGHPHELQFDCTVIGDPIVVNEVFTNADESLRIKSNFMGKFWKCSDDDWIYADSDDSTSNDSYTMFWPVKLGDNVIALRNKGNNKFCTRSTAKDKITGSLSANGTTIVEEAYLKVEEIPKHMSMVMKLPKHVAFKDINGNYLRARLIKGHPHLLQFESTVIEDPTVGNEVFANADGSLRIKYNSSGKYWRVSEDDWISADSDDSTNNDPHTLFWPVRLGDNAIALRNKHNKKFCMRFTANDKITDGLSANVTTINEETHLEVEEIPDPDSAVIKLPKYVAFKDRNGNYISTSFTDGQPHLLQFEPTVIGDPTVLNEVFINADRSLRIKSNSSRKFWMLAEDDWICADSDDSTGNYSHTLFWPVRLGDNVIALRNKLNDKFCSRFTTNDKIKGGLKANVTTIDEETHLEVEEIPHPESLVMKLPKHVAFKDHNGNYLSTSLIDGHPHVLQFDCTVIGDPIVVNEVFTNADESLRIKSNFMGKFWRCSEDDWIYADSDDSTSNDSYTMFWPVKLGDNVIALRNKGNNKFCTRSTAKDKITSSLSANGTIIVEEAYLKVEEIPKHMSMVMKLPKHVAFKDIKGNYLRARLIKGHPHLLQFESTVIGDPTVGNEVFANDDGSLRIKYNSSGKYWRVSEDDWICADSDDSTNNDPHTLFWPVRLGDNAIALRNKHNKKFCMRFTANDKITDGLSANVTTINEETHLEVEEIPDPDSAVIKLPKYVAFKDRNGNYISTSFTDGQPHLLQFEPTVIGDPTVLNEVFINADRSLRIKSNSSRKFWMLTEDDWICADSDDSTNNYSHTLFWPVRLGDNVIALRNKLNDKFCLRFTANDKIKSGMNANVTTIDEEAHLEVEEIPHPESLVIKLPKHVAFKDHNGNYLSTSLIDEHPQVLQFDCTVIGDPIVVNEVFTNADESLRIKSNFMGKFWRCSEDDWIYADSDDSTSNDSYTMFWPVKLGDNVITLRNKGNNKFCTKSTAKDKITGSLSANGTTIVEEVYLKVEEIPKQMSMVMKLPKHVALKDINGNYLRARLIEGHPHSLQFESTIIGDPTVGNEVFANADGSLRIKYNSSGKYWRVSEDDWICADSDDSTNNDPHTLFWPVRLGDNAIALRNKHNKKFCTRFTANDKITDGLSANMTTINEETHLEVEEIPYPDSAVIKLPKYVAFKDRNGNYISTSFTDGQPHLLQFEPTVIGDPTVLNEVFINADRSLRIKSNSSRKFWMLTEDDWICADSDDSASNYSHTLFWPVRLGDNVIALRNKLNDKFCLRFTANDKIKSGLNANVTTIDEEAHLEVEEIPHPESLVIKLPKHVAFKDHNGNYLSTSLIDGHPQVLQFDCTVIGDPIVVNEVFTNADESLRIKSNFIENFWRCSEDDWIYADSDDSTSNDSYTMFWPVKLGDNVIALRNKGNNKFCTRSTAKDKITGSLSANGTTIVEEAYLKVEEIPKQMSMVMKLPKHVAFKDINGNYLRARLIEGHPHSLQFESTVIGDPTVVNEIFTNVDGSLRIKYNSSGKYWRVSEDDWICADSNDSTNNDPHTLFWPVRLGDNAIALRNKHNKKFCMRFTANDKITDVLSANVTIINEEAHLEVEEIPDPDSVVIKLPKHVAFKDRNGNYLSTNFINGQPHLLQFEPTVIGDPTVVNEVFTNADRSLRVKSNSSGKFWRLTEDDWICADSDDSISNYSQTLFWPVRLGDKVIALRSKLNDKFCLGLTTSDKITSGLNANVTTIHEEAHLEVEEIPHPESLVIKLPKHVAFKDRNGNYLSNNLIDEHPHVLQFECTVIGDPIVVNEVFTNADKSICIKSNFSGKFWRCTEDGWICADSDDSTRSDSHTMFWHVKLGDNVIALRNKGNSKFCTTSTAQDNITGRLSANGITIVEEAHLGVEEIPEHMSMVMKLPKHVAFKGRNGNYLRARLIEGHLHSLQFDSTVIGDPTVVNEVFTNDDGSLRIKYNSSGKYWRVTNDDWICADSDDSTNNDPHTLFWPVKLGDNAIALRNKLKKKFCMRFTANDKITDGLSANVTTINEEAYLEVEDIPDPDSMVIKLPKHVAFKDRNGNYLSTSFTDGQPHMLQFESTVIGDPTVVNEVFTNDDGSLRIKSSSSGKFWRLTEDDWICPDSDDSTSNYSHALFWPVRLDDNVIALRNKLNDKFCMRFTANDKITRGLNASATTINEEAHVEVEEIPHPESLVVKLPKHVAFKDRKGNYLSTSLIDGHPYLLQFECTVIGDPIVVNEIFTNADGSLCIRSNFSGKFWRLTEDDWISADSDDSPRNDSHNLFWPVRLGDNVIALRNKRNNKFCMRFTSNDKITGGLRANVSSIVDEVYLEVEEIPNQMSVVVKLPKHLAFMDRNGYYLRDCLVDGYRLQFESTVIGDPTVVNEVLTNVDGSLRIKSNSSGKFWRLTEDDYICADSDDSTNDDSRTLFWPVRLGDSIIALRNKLNKKFCMRFTANDKIAGGLSENVATIYEKAHLEVEEIPHLKSLVKELPKHVAFKDRNGDYLSISLIDEHPHLLQFESTFIGDPTVVNEVFTNADGSLRIKSNSSGKFWKVTEDDWICADSDDSTSNDFHTLFWPVRLGDNVIALRNKLNNKFCMRFTTSDKSTSGLNANASTINEDAHLEVEEIPNPESLVIKLPKHVAFKDRNGNYLSSRLLDEHPHLLQFQSTVIGDLTVVNEVFTNTNGSLRIKSYSSSKFWRLTLDDWICADSDDTTTNDFHTLFWPVKLSDNVIALRSIRNNKFCQRSTITDKITCGLRANVTTIDEEAFLEVEEVPEPELQAATFPKHMAFRDHNGNFLGTLMINWLPHSLQFESTDIGDPTVGNEVFTDDDGSLCIKSNSSGKVWRLSSDDWICADSDDSTRNNDSSMLIGPIKVFKRFTAANKITSSISANVPIVDNEAYLKVKEVVVLREIYNVTFYLGDARIYDKMVVTLATGEAVNETGESQTVELKLTYTKTRSGSLKSNVFKLGIESSIDGRVPVINDNGRIEMDEFIGTVQRGKTGATTIFTCSVNEAAVYKVVLPEFSTMKVQLLATKASYDVPFSYAQRDTLARGEVITNNMDDGVYTGTNTYDVKFETRRNALALP